MLRSTKSFKFEANWLVNDACSRVVHGAQADRVLAGDPLDILLCKLENCKCFLVRWNNKKGKKKRLIWLKKQTKKVEDLQCQATPTSMGEIKRTQGEIDDMLEREDLKWKQRAKVHWLQHGD